MWKIILIAITIFSFVAPIQAEDKWIDVDCFEFSTINKTNNNNVIIANTAKQLTSEKDTFIRSKKELNKNANKIGKTIYGKLMKLDDTANVSISARQIAVFRYPYPDTEKSRKEWKEKVVKTIYDTLCK